jgi:hypothetical protein
MKFDQILVLDQAFHRIGARNDQNVEGENGVEVVALSRFVLKEPRPEALLLEFTGFDARALREGVDRLAVALERRARRKAGARRPGLRHG